MVIFITLAFKKFLKKFDAHLLCSRLYYLSFAFNDIVLSLLYGIYLYNMDEIQINGTK